mmetsp:Transcript_1155/g.3591  ORF Transcript_1155/g.3591 Transcript_1155/m.3591 type:complete len:150 (+) Transcript_1155:90-539(+)
MRLAALASRQTNVVRRHVGHAGKCQRPSLRRAAVETRALFNFGSNNAQKNQGPTRADYDEQEVEDYFNYMGMLASDGNYDRLNEYTNAGLDCVDLLLLMAASEGDTPKVEELLEAGANVNVSSDKVYGGKTAIELCTKEEIKEMLQAKV